MKMETIKTLCVTKKEYNGLNYYKITSPQSELIESNWETLEITKGILNNWKANNLLGSFGIGFILDQNADIVWRV